MNRVPPHGQPKRHHIKASNHRFRSQPRKQSELSCQGAGPRKAGRPQQRPVKPHPLRSRPFASCGAGMWARRGRRECPETLRSRCGPPVARCWAAARLVAAGTGAGGTTAAGDGGGTTGGAAKLRCWVTLVCCTMFGCWMSGCCCGSSAASVCCSRPARHVFGR